METAAKNVKELQQHSGTPNMLTGAQEVLKVTQPRQGKNVLLTCHCCDKTGNKEPQCAVKHLKCFKCGIWTVCRTRRRTKEEYSLSVPYR